MLSWSIIHAAISVHNSVSSARHGAFRESLSGTKRYEDRSSSGSSYGSSNLNAAEQESREFIAYYPTIQQKILSKPSSNSTTAVDVQATIDFIAPYKNVNGGEDLVYTSRVQMNRRKPKHWDHWEGPNHKAAFAEWESFRARVSSISAQSVSGPIPPR